MNKKYIVRLTDEERTQLEHIVSKGQTTARQFIHANVLLKADASGPHWPDHQVADAFGIHPNTVGAIRERCVLEGVATALNRKPQRRPSRMRKLDGAGEARLLALACSAPPEGRARWTLRLLANRVVELAVVDRISHETVRGVLKKTISSRT